MAVSTDILRTWRTPRVVMARLLAFGQREDRAIFYLMLGCFMMFVAQLPVMARIAHLSEEASVLDPARPVLERNMLFGTAFFGWLMVMPLVMYLVAGLAHGVLRVFGAASTGYGARLALFWSLLAASPLALLLGLLNGLNGQSPGTTLVGVLWIGVFLWFWVQTTREAIKPHTAPA